MLVTKSKHTSAQENPRQWSWALFASEVTSACFSCGPAESPRGQTYLRPPLWCPPWVHACNVLAGDGAHAPSLFPCTLTAVACCCKPLVVVDRLFGHHDRRSPYLHGVRGVYGDVPAQRVHAAPNSKLAFL